jgi:hypothetical protein
MTPLTIKEIQSIPHLLDPHRVFLCAMLQDELFEEQKRAFVRDLLTDLNERLPCILCSELGAVGTLGMLDEVFDLEHLLENGGGEYLGVSWYTRNGVIQNERERSAHDTPLFES